MPYLIPGCLTLLALIVVGAGIQFGAKFRRPRLFQAGAGIAATGLILLWVLPWWASSTDAGDWAMPLMMAAFFAAIFVLAGGLSTMARAATGSEATHGDQILQDFLQLNDLD